MAVLISAIEVKNQDARIMTEISKENMKLGDFILFQMRKINKNAYNKAIHYIKDKSINTWTIVNKYMSEGAQFKLDLRGNASSVCYLQSY
jgi:hypothetical protein